jgi:hypothetical protein
VRSSAPAALALLLALAGAARAAPADLAATLPAAASLPPLALRGPVERHSAETLWERIDGEAELYKAYGLTTSVHAVYEDPANPDRRVDLSVFAFADPLGGFGLFAAFRPPECTVRALGNGGCVGDYQGFFWHGELFVLADAAGPAAGRPDDLRRALEAVAALLGPPPPRPEPLRAFSRFADTRTIRYQPQHLLGRAALPPGLEGTAGGTPVFVSTGADTAQGATALEAYAGMLEGPVRVERDGVSVLSGRDPALGPVTIAVGRRGMSGARSAPTAPGVRELLEALSAHGGDPALEGAW